MGFMENSYRKVRYNSPCVVIPRSQSREHSWLFDPSLLFCTGGKVHKASCFFQISACLITDPLPARGVPIVSVWSSVPLHIQQRGQGGSEDSLPAFDNF